MKRITVFLTCIAFLACTATHAGSPEKPTYRIRPVGAKVLQTKTVNEINYTLVYIPKSVTQSTYAELSIELWCDEAHTTWWKARFTILCYIYSADGPRRFGYPPPTYSWKWVDKTWECEMPPNVRYNEIRWTLSGDETFHTLGDPEEGYMNAWLDSDYFTSVTWEAE